MDWSTMKLGLKELGKKVGEQSPTILTGLAVAGVLTTTIMAVKATPKALYILEDEEKKKKRALTKKEMIKLTWKCYVPATLMGSATIACIIGANSIHLRRSAALASAYSIADTALREYQEKVLEVVGKNKEAAVRDAIAEDKLNANPLKESTVIVTSKGDTLCYDSLSGRYFTSDIEAIKKVVNELNREIINEGYKTLNDLYFDLGLEVIEMGHNVGWHIDYGLIDVYFTAKVADNGHGNRPCIVLSFRNAPRKL